MQSRRADGLVKPTPVATDAHQQELKIRFPADLMQSCSRLIGVFVGVKTAKLRHGSDELGTKQELRPALGETFVVGDGLTGTGTGDIQTIAIPKGATKLYLGYAGDTYGTNAGGVSAIITQHAK